VVGWLRQAPWLMLMPLTSVKAMINYDLLTEADGLPASVKAFCLPRLSFVQ